MEELAAIETTYIEQLIAATKQGCDIIWATAASCKGSRGTQAGEHTHHHTTCHGSRLANSKPRSTSSYYTLSTCLHYQPSIFASTCAGGSCQTISAIPLLSNQTLNPTAAAAAAHTPHLLTPHPPQKPPKKTAQCAAIMYCSQGACSSSTVDAWCPPTAAAVVILALCICVCAANRSADNTPSSRHLQHILHH